MLQKCAPFRHSNSSPAAISFPISFGIDHTTDPLDHTHRITHLPFMTVAAQLPSPVGWHPWHEEWYVSLSLSNP